MLLKTGFGKWLTVLCDIFLEYIYTHRDIYTHIYIHTYIYKRRDLTDTNKKSPPHQTPALTQHLNRHPQQDKQALNKHRPSHGNALIPQ